PEGPLEEMMVDQIIQASWRLRRARTAESGEIALSVDEGCWRRARHNPLPIILNMPRSLFSDALTSQLEHSALGCHYLAYGLRKVRADVEQAGELTEPALNDLKSSLRDQPDPFITRLEKFRAELAANPDQLEPEVLRARHRAEVLKFLDRKIRDQEFLETEREEREHAEERSRRTAAVLPSEA